MKFMWHYLCKKKFRPTGNVKERGFWQPWKHVRRGWKVHMCTSTYICTFFPVIRFKKNPPCIEPARLKKLGLKSNWKHSSANNGHNRASAASRQTTPVDWWWWRVRGWSISAQKKKSGQKNVKIQATQWLQKVSQVLWKSKKIKVFKSDWNYLKLFQNI